MTVGKGSNEITESIQIDVRIPLRRLACGAFRSDEANERCNQIRDLIKESMVKKSSDHNPCPPTLCPVS